MCVLGRVLGGRSASLGRTVGWAGRRRTVEWSPPRGQLRRQCRNRQGRCVRLVTRLLSDLVTQDSATQLLSDSASQRSPRAGGCGPPACSVTSRLPPRPPRPAPRNASSVAASPASCRQSAAPPQPPSRILPVRPRGAQRLERVRPPPPAGSASLACRTWSSTRLCEPSNEKDKNLWRSFQYF